MEKRNDTSLVRGRAGHDPFSLLRQMTSELDRVFELPFGMAFRGPAFRASGDLHTWAPEIDVFERDNRLVTRVDLPGLKKEDVKVEVVDGHLAISGERQSDTAEKKDNVYRRERSHGSFYRAIPLPDGAKFEDVTATFGDGVLEVSVALPVRTDAATRTVKVEDAVKPGKSAAA